ncbi:EAL domain-containing protein [uncultured Sphingorhabdus sp.]|uniref:EAL domain-containing protein n=1 Tax=uncultured Sphingorhabdus sp. TaxID=1686106 RepID=UPI0026302D73|nr:EAL domain-containing protein [uncultured Sphingorhabdus sp.]
MALNLNRKKIARTIMIMAAICGGLGAIGIFEPVTLLINSLQSQIRTKPVSGDIVVVGIDSPSIREIGRWPWPRDVQGQLLQKVDQYQPKAIYLDIGYQGKTTAKADQYLRQSIEGLQSKTKIIALATDANDGTVRSIYSHEDAVGRTAIVTAYFPYLFGYVWTLPTTIETEKGKLQSLAASIAGRHVPEGQNFRVDYSFDPRTIKQFAAKDVLSGSVPAKDIEGKTVVIGVTDMTQNDVHSMPGWGEKPGVLFHVLGAETLKQGYPFSWGWLPFFVMAMLFGGIQLTSFGLKLSKLLSWSGASLTVITSSWLTTIHIGNDPLPAIVLIASMGIYIGRQKAALMRAQRNEHTGFADMTGYRVKEVVSNAIFIGATIKRSETKRDSVAASDQKHIMKEVGRRLSSFIDEKQLTHNDNQQFLWEMPPTETGTLGEHLEGIRRMFSAPIVIDGRQIDIDIFFGVDRNINANVEQRMESALDASIIARDTAATFKIATANSFDEHLTKHFGTEFDLAVAMGDINVIFEPQQALKSGRPSDAEVSLIWMHPAYGEIRGAKLFALASLSGHLTKASLHLCEEASKYAGQIASIWPGFSMSIKVSVPFIASNEFERWLKSSMQAKHFRPHSLIFNLIDVHEHSGENSTIRAMQNVQEHGFRVSIGRFGIMNTDIDLLERFKPNEICLDKNFSAELLGSTSSQIFADAAIRIAKILNIQIVADGLEDRAVLLALKDRGCDRAQGKIIANALNYKELAELMSAIKAKKTG